MKTVGKYLLLPFNISWLQSGDICCRYNVGPSRSSVLQNRDVVKELRVGALIAIAGINFPKVGEVLSIPPNPSLDSDIDVQWMNQERAPHKPRWQRCFKLGPKNALGSTKMSDILLYSFQLTNKGCLKKKSRDYLKSTLDM